MASAYFPKPQFPICDKGMLSVSESCWEDDVYLSAQEKEASMSFSSTYQIKSDFPVEWTCLLPLPYQLKVLETTLPAVRSPSRHASAWGLSLHPGWLFPDGRSHWGPRRRGGECQLGWSRCTALGWSPPHARPSSISAQSSALSLGRRKTGVRVNAKVLQEINEWVRKWSLLACNFPQSACHKTALYSTLPPKTTIIISRKAKYDLHNHTSIVKISPYDHVEFSLTARCRMGTVLSPCFPEEEKI